MSTGKIERHHLLRKFTGEDYAPACCGKRVPWTDPLVHRSWRTFVKVEKSERCKRCDSKVFRRP
jgi:hypothetical protein